MKEKLNSFLLTLTICIAAVALPTTGCSSLLSPVTTQNETTNVAPVSVLQTNVIPVNTFQTNIVVVNQTNFATTVVPVTTFQTNVVPVTVMQTNIVTVTTTNSFQVASGVTTALAAAQVANTISSPFDPYAPLAAGVMTLISGLLGWYAKQKTAALKTQASTAQTVITAIEGLEPAVAAGVKTAVTAKSQQMGTSAAVSSVVAAVTSQL
jgi:hypothetical protein